MLNVIILIFSNDGVNGRRLGSIRNVGGLNRVNDESAVINDGTKGNILVNGVGVRSVDLVGVRICSHIDSLYGIGICLGNDDTVKTVNLRYGLCIEKQCRGGLKRLKEDGVGCIPLQIVKILVELDRAVVILPLFYLLRLLNLEVKYYSANEQGEESCHEAEEQIEHRIVKSAGLCPLSLRKCGDHHCKERRECHQRTKQGSLMFLKDVHNISILHFLPSTHNNGKKK